MKKNSPWLGLSIALMLIWSLLPIYWMVRMAFLTPAEITQFPPPLFPSGFNVASFFNVLGYDHALANGTMMRASGQANQVLHGLQNSLIVAVIVTAITLVIVIPLAYVFARLEFRFKNLLLNAVLLAVALPPVSTLIPFYSMFVQLKLAGTLTGLVLVDLTLTVPFVAWMLIGYFRNLPPVERLARVDGYTRFGTLFFLIVPMAKSGVAVAAVISFLFAWNEFTFALILVNGTTANTLPTAISGFLFQNPEPSNLAACIVLTIIPPALVAYFLQRHVAEMSLVDPVR